MADPRIIDVRLDGDSIPPRSQEIGREREIALADLVADNHFAPVRPQPDNYAGPYRLHLLVKDGRLVLAVARADGSALETHILGLSRFRRLIREYAAVCESHLAAVRTAGAQQVETLDMARRGLHNDGAELLRDCLAGKVTIDFATARRLFTLICVLHIKA